MEPTTSSSDQAFVHVLRLALRGCRPGDAAVRELGDAYDRGVLLRTLRRFERLAADEPDVTVRRAASIVVAALSDVSVGKTA